MHDLVIVTLIASLTPLISWILWNKLNLERAKYLALGLLLPALFTVLDFLTCVQRSLMEWFWLNCGLPPLERLITALTMPPVLTSLSSTLLALLGMVKRKGLYFYLATVLSSSSLFVWFNYLNLNYPALSQNPNLPPLGYGVVRSYYFFLYLPIYTLGAILVWSYLIERDEGLLRLGSILLALSLLLCSFWGLYGFGVPLPLTLYHLGILFTFLSSLALLHDRSALAASAFLSSFVLTLVLPRLTETGFGGMATPFFGLQTSVGVAYGVLAVVAFLRALKGLNENVSRKFLLVELSSIALLVIGVVDLASNVAFGTSFAATVWAVVVTLLLSALNLSLVGYLAFREKVGLALPLALLHPLSGALANVLYPAYLFIRFKDFRKVLMAAAAISLALMMLYSSNLYLLTPYKGSYEIKFEKNATVRTLKYKGNVTVLEYRYLYKINVSAENATRELRIPMTVRINVFLGRYIAPNAIIYFSWSTPVWEGLSVCALSARGFLAKPAPNVDYYYLVCAPLGVEGVLAPALALATLIVNRRTSRSTR